jgi:signal transduction histidine kinase
MGETELIKFIVLASVMLLIFIWGIIAFIIKYQNRKLMYEKEKAAQDERHVREMLFTKIEIQQNTMRDIGREIHDNVGQRLTLAAMYIYQLEYEQKETKSGARISEVSNILNESMEELRNLSKSLTNANAEKWELHELVDNECKRVNALNICKVTYTFNTESIVAASTIKSFLHRIIQEFFQNSLKHARCKNILLDFNLSPTELTVRLEDDGVGFDIEQYNGNANKGIGLSNMKKRAEFLGISHTLESAPGMGTKVKLVIPVSKLNAENATV